jgi:hypothetical protein
MKTARKGSRTVTVNGTDYSWYRGRSNTEIRNLETNKAEVVENIKIETMLETSCDCCGEPDGGETGVTMPANVRHYIMANPI